MAESTPQKTAEVILKAARENPTGVIGVKGADLLHAFGTKQEQAGNGPGGNESGDAQG